MTYQDYFRNSDFEDIWTILSGFYMEHEDLKPLYSSLVESIKSLPVMPEYSEPTIQMCLDSENEILVKGAPDPQEWLLGREVEIDFSSWKDELSESVTAISGFKTFDMLSGAEKRQLARDSNTATLAAHLLYWSTLYAIKTHGQHAKEFEKWFDSLEMVRQNMKRRKNMSLKVFRGNKENIGVRQLLTIHQSTGIGIWLFWKRNWSITSDSGVTCSDMSVGKMM